MNGQIIRHKINILHTIHPFKSPPTAISPESIPELWRWGNKKAGSDWNLNPLVGGV